MGLDHEDCHHDCRRRCNPGDLDSDTNKHARRALKQVEDLANPSYHTYYTTALVFSRQSAFLGSGAKGVLLTGGGLGRMGR